MLLDENPSWLNRSIYSPPVYSLHMHGKCICMLVCRAFSIICAKNCSFETIPYEKRLLGWCYITALEAFKLSKLSFKMSNRLHTVTLFAYIHAEIRNVTKCKPHQFSPLWRHLSWKTRCSQTHIFWKPTDSHHITKGQVSSVWLCEPYITSWKIFSMFIFFVVGGLSQSLQSVIQCNFTSMLISNTTDYNVFFILWIRKA